MPAMVTLTGRFLASAMKSAAVLKGESMGTIRTSGSSVYRATAAKSSALYWVSLRTGLVTTELVMANTV